MSPSLTPFERLRSCCGRLHASHAFARPVQRQKLMGFRHPGRQQPSGFQPSVVTAQRFPAGRGFVISSKPEPITTRINLTTPHGPTSAAGSLASRAPPHTLIFTSHPHTHTPTPMPTPTLPQTHLSPVTPRQPAHSESKISRAVLSDRNCRGERKGFILGARRLVGFRGWWR